MCTKVIFTIKQGIITTGLRLRDHIRKAGADQLVTRRYIDRQTILKEENYFQSMPHVLLEGHKALEVKAA